MNTFTIELKRLTSCALRLLQAQGGEKRNPVCESFTPVGMAACITPGSLEVRVFSLVLRSRGVLCLLKQVSGSCLKQRVDRL